MSLYTLNLSDTIIKILTETMRCLHTLTTFTYGGVTYTLYVVDTLRLYTVPGDLYFKISSTDLPPKTIKSIYLSKDINMVKVSDLVFYLHQLFMNNNINCRQFVVFVNVSENV